MKSCFVLCFVILLSMIVSPVAALDFKEFSFDNVIENFSSEKGESESETTNAEESGNSTVSVLAVASGNIITTTELDYLVGCVACEMPPTYHEEALKAQAVAAYTNLVRMKKSPDKALNGADISDSPSKHQGYYDEAARREKWGDKYDAYNEKVTSAVTSVIGEIIEYDGSPISAAYCAICPGRTESAENIWGGSIPYLQSVVSSGDKLSPDYSSAVVLSTEQVREMTASDSEISLSDNPEEWLTNIETTDTKTGVVKSLTVGGKTLTGMEARNMFSLRSPSFTVAYADGSFTFNVSGYGHCVGMSQYGADYMARQGSSYKEILEHYYKGAQVKVLSR